MQICNENGAEYKAEKQKYTEQADRQIDRSRKRYSIMKDKQGEADKMRNLDRKG